MANKDASKPEEAPNTHATYERSEDQTTQKKGERSDGKRSTPLPAGGKIEGDMNSEEAAGRDQAPRDVRVPHQKRRPRPDKIGGSRAEAARLKQK